MEHHHDDSNAERRANFVKLHSLKSGFSIADRTNLWRYAQYYLDSEEAQLVGDTIGARDLQMSSQEGYRVLTPNAQTIAPEYLSLLREQVQIENNTSNPPSVNGGLFTRQ